MNSIMVATFAFVGVLAGVLAQLRVRSRPRPLLNHVIRSKLLIALNRRGSFVGVDEGWARAAASSPISEPLSPCRWRTGISFRLPAH